MGQLRKKEQHAGDKQKLHGVRVVVKLAGVPC